MHCVTVFFCSRASPGPVTGRSAKKATRQPIQRNDAMRCDSMRYGTTPPRSRRAPRRAGPASEHRDGTTDRSLSLSTGHACSRQHTVCGYDAREPKGVERIGETTVKSRGPEARGGGQAARRLRCSALTLTHTCVGGRSAASKPRIFVRAAAEKQRKMLCS